MKTCEILFCAATFAAVILAVGGIIFGNWQVAIVRAADVVLFACYLAIHPAIVRFLKYSKEKS